MSGMIFKPKARPAEKLLGNSFCETKGPTKCPSTAAAAAYLPRALPFGLSAHFYFGSPLSVAVIAEPLWAKPLLQITRPLAHCNGAPQ